jgi:hypothetical protein
MGGAMSAILDTCGAGGEEITVVRCKPVLVGMRAGESISVRNKFVSLLAPVSIRQA